MGINARTVACVMAATLTMTCAKKLPPGFIVYEDEDDEAQCADELLAQCDGNELVQALALQQGVDALDCISITAIPETKGEDAELAEATNDAVARCADRVIYAAQTADPRERMKEKIPPELAEADIGLWCLDVAARVCDRNMLIDFARGKIRNETETLCRDRVRTPRGIQWKIDHVRMRIRQDCLGNTLQKPTGRLRRGQQT